MDNTLTISLYLAINETDQPREISHWHASSIAKCPRALYFERKGIKGLPSNEPSGAKKLRWRSGHAIEATIRPELEKLYPQMLANVRFTNTELDLTGEFDGYDPTTKTLISVKSVHDFAFITRDNVTGLKERTGTDARGKAAFELKKEPYIHHQWQEHSYVILLRHAHTKSHGAYQLGELVPYEVSPLEITQPLSMQPLSVEHITYVYITLSGLIACYTTDVNPEILDKVERKLTYLRECWEKNELPVCLCQDGREMYQVTDQYCPYRNGEICCDENLIKENAHE